MKAKVDQTLCIGCGLCEGDLPEVFAIGDEGYAEVLVCPVEVQFHETLKQVVGNCPTTAISIEENAPSCAEEEKEEATQDCCCCNKESNQSKTERNFKMKVKVDEDLCIGCGICEGIAPEVFSLETEPHAVVLLDPVPEEFLAAAREAAESCPESAILIEE